MIATEVDKNLVRELNKRVAREQLSNVEVVLAPSNDVGIASGSADRILVVDVWHHIIDRKRYASRIARALAPGGKIVVVDFKPLRNGHGVAPERVLAELSAGASTAPWSPTIWPISTSSSVRCARRPATPGRDYSQSLAVSSLCWNDGFRHRHSLIRILRL